jgi:hypothetical protein
MDTRRKIIQEAEYERSEWLKRYDPNEVLKRDQTWDLDRARHDPPLSEILSGKALNTLLNHLAKQQGLGQRGSNVPLPEDLLKGINLTGQDTRANAGLLKNDGRLQWPLSLEGSEFADSREHINSLLRDAVSQAKNNNPILPGKLKDLRVELGRMNDALLRYISGMSLSQYIEARRYLNLLDDALKALEDPKVSNYFTEKWVVKNKNAAELVNFMAQSGLQFAPAVPGDVDSYRALYRALQVLDAGMPAVASSGSDR